MNAVRVLGVDPGERHIGVALLDVSGHRGAVVSLATWDAGRADELGEQLAAVVALAPGLVVVERVEHVHGSERMGSGYAAGLARCNWIGGLLAGLAQARHLRVATVSAPEWRRALVGSRSPSDATIAQVIRLRVPNWPERSNAHQRDAAGCALWVGLRSEVA